MRFFSNSSPASCVDSSRCSRTIVSDDDDDDDDDDDAKKDDEDDDDDDDDIDGDDDTRWTRRRRFLFPRRLFWPPRKTPSPPPKKKRSFFCQKTREQLLATSFVSLRFVSFRFVSSERERERERAAFLCVSAHYSRKESVVVLETNFYSRLLFEHIMERESVLNSFRLQFHSFFIFHLSLSRCIIKTALVLLGRNLLFYIFSGL